MCHDAGPYVRLNIGCRPSCLLLDERGFVVIAEQIGGAVDELTDHVTAGPGELLRGIGRERKSSITAYVRMAQHALGIVGTDEDEVEAADLVVERGQVYFACIGHGTGIKRDNLRVGIVSRNGATGRVKGGRHVEVPALDPGLHEPVAVAQVVEVLANGRHQQRLVSEGGESEGDVGATTAASDVQVIDQERQRNLVELIGNEGIGEFTLECHEVVGRNRARYCDMHGNRLNDPLRDVRIAKGIRGFIASETTQWNESPQAQEPVATGLSMVNPCFSIVSTKLMVAPPR